MRKEGYFVLKEFRMTALKLLSLFECDQRLTVKKKVLLIEYKKKTKAIKENIFLSQRGLPFRVKNCS